MTRLYGAHTAHTGLHRGVMAYLCKTNEWRPPCQREVVGIWSRKSIFTSAFRSGSRGALSIYFRPGSGELIDNLAEPVAIRFPAQGVSLRFSHKCYNFYDAIETDFTPRSACLAKTRLAWSALRQRANDLLLRKFQILIQFRTRTFLLYLLQCQFLTKTQHSRKRIIK